MAQQTVVDWLEDQYIKHSGNLLEMKKSFEQAKEMVREQIEDAFQDGKWDWAEHITKGTESKDLAQYYNEKYGTNS